MEWFELIRTNWPNLVMSFLLVLLPTILGRLLITFLLDRVLLVIAGKTKTKLDDMLLAKLRTPVYLLVVLSAINLALVNSRALFETWADTLLRLVGALFLFVGFWILGRVSSTFFQWYEREMVEQTETELDDHLVPFVDRVANIIILALGTITILSHFDVDVTGLVATLGIASLAIALAAQASLADVISGILVIADRPFRVGDQITLDTFPSPLIVLQVGMRSTRLRTFDNRVVIVPNSNIAQSNLINRTFPHSVYRLQTAVGIGYGSDVDMAKAVIKNALQKIDHIYREKPVDVYFLGFGDSSLDLVVRWWIELPMGRDVSLDAVNTAILNALNEANIEIPFPQRDVHLIQAGM